MNKLIIAGRLGQDAELKVLANDNNVLKFSVATSEKWKDKEGVKQEKTTWHNCNLWGKRAAALAQYLVKGTFVIVEGSIETSTYEKDGVKQYRTDVKVSNVEFGGGAAKSAQSESTPGEDEVPF